MVEKKAEFSSAVDIAVIRPDGPIRDDKDRLSRFLELKDLARIEIVQLRKQAAVLESQLEVINMAVKMMEKRYPIKGRR